MDTQERKKNVKARQASDGTFELFVSELGLEEISEDEVSFAENLPLVDERKSKSRVPLFILLSLVSVLLLGFGAWALTSMFGSQKTLAEELPKVQGFRAYMGKGPSKKLNSHIRKKSALSLKKKDKAEPKEKQNKEKREIEDEDPTESLGWKFKDNPTSPNDMPPIEANRNPTLEEVEIQHDEVVLDLPNEETTAEAKAANEKGQFKMGLVKTPIINPNIAKDLKFDPSMIRPELLKMDLKEIRRDLADEE